jgi:hypothetical protein
LQRATVTPTKAELIAGWAPAQPWGPSSSDDLQVIGAFRFDDPNGRVGLETHLLSAAGAVFQVPLTYRDEPLGGADEALVGEMQHSVLGRRWVYDGVRDPLFTAVLVGVALTGQGEALAMVVDDGRWHIAPAGVRIRGGGWTKGRVAVDGFELRSDEAAGSVLHNDRFELRLFRRPVAQLLPALGLSATWDGQVEPVVLAAVSERRD